MRASIALHLCQYLVLSMFWLLAILISVQWYLIVILIFNYPITYDVEHLLICLFVTCKPSLVRCCLDTLPFFILGCLHLNCWVLRVLCIFWISTLSNVFFKDLLQYGSIWAVRKDLIALFLILASKHLVSYLKLWC